MIYLQQITVKIV